MNKIILYIATSQDGFIVINTITSLLKKQVWFSRVYDFNDPYEYKLVHEYVHERYKDTITEDKLAEYCSDPYALHRLIECLLNKYSYFKNNPEFTRGKEWLDEVIALLMDKKYKELISGGIKYADVLDHILYAKTGIFSMSLIDVFKDDSAMLMFAHYASKLTGLALVFTIDDQVTSIKEIVYCTRKPTEAKEVRLHALEDQPYVEPFLHKSSGWSYKKEYRLFYTPGLHDMDKLGLRLSGIFYTDKFDNVSHLEIIKNKHYDNIFIQYVCPSHSKLKPFQFVVGDKSIPEFLHSNS